MVECSDIGPLFRSRKPTKSEISCANRNVEAGHSRLGRNGVIIRTTLNEANCCSVIRRPTLLLVAETVFVSAISTEEHRNEAIMKTRAN